MGVTYLLDTHVLLWLIGDPDKLTDKVRSTLADRSNRLLVSAASAMEVATRTRDEAIRGLPAPRILRA